MRVGTAVVDVEVVVDCLEFWFDTGSEIVSGGKVPIGVFVLDVDVDARGSASDSASQSELDSDMGSVRGVAVVVGFRVVLGTVILRKVTVRVGLGSGLDLRTDVTL